MALVGTESTVALQPWQLPASSICAVDAITGFNAHAPLVYSEKHSAICTVVGNAVSIYRFTSQPLKIVDKQVIWGRDGGGIGSISLLPKGDILAVAEKLGDVGVGAFNQTGPNIYLYDITTGTLVCAPMQGGTERGYSDVCFSPDGSLLASVGAFPDFSLTVWELRKETDASKAGMPLSARVVLRTKAFGQDVFNVRFSPYATEAASGGGRLVTSGSSHIRFWKMASTFTGLKLQGDIGKFGKVDLSDVNDFAELPDGKVVSTSESGYMLLWEGNIIKCQIGRLRPKQLIMAPQALQVTDSKYEDTQEGKVTARSGRSSARSSIHGGLSELGSVPSLTDRFDFIPAHDAPLHAVSIDQDLHLFITAGDDGVVRWWDVKFIDTADTSDEYPIPCFEPLHECKLPTAPCLRSHGEAPAKPRKIVKLSQREADAAVVQAALAEAGIQEPEVPVVDTARSRASSISNRMPPLHPKPQQSIHRTFYEAVWLVPDAAGVLWTVTVYVRVSKTIRAGVESVQTDIVVRSVDALLEGHTSTVSGLALADAGSSDVEAAVISGGADGTLREWITDPQPADSGKSPLTSTSLQQRASYVQVVDVAASQQPQTEEDVGHGPVPSLALPQEAAGDEPAPPVQPVAISCIAGHDGSRSGGADKRQFMAAGFSDGSLRLFVRAKSGIVRTSASKPHTKPVTSVSISPNATYLVTAGADHTLFFFAIDAGLALHPIGYIHMRDAYNKANSCDATALTWSADSRRLYIGGSDSVIRRIAVPSADPARVENTLSLWPRADHTYELIGVSDLFNDTANENNVFSVALFRLRLKLSVIKPAPPVDPNEKKKKAAEMKEDSPSDAPTSDQQEGGGESKQEGEGASPAAAVAVATPTMEIPAALGAVTAIAVVNDVDTSSSTGGSFLPDTLLVCCAGDCSNFVFETEASTAPGGVKVSKSGKAALTAAELAAMLGGNPLLAEEKAVDPLEQFPGAAIVEPTAVYAVAPLRKGENLQQSHATLIRLFPELRLMVVGLSDGALAFKSLVHRGPVYRVQLHDGTRGAVSGICVSALPTAVKQVVSKQLSHASTSASVLFRIHSAAKDGSIVSCVVDADLLVSGAADVLDALVLPVIKPQAIDRTNLSPYSGVIASSDINVLRGIPAGPIPDAASAAVPKLVCSGSPTSTQATVNAYPDIASVEDVAASAYSIEEDKQRSEADARFRDAEVEKSKVRRKIAALRDAFAAFRRKMAEEASVDAGRALSEDELVIDPQLLQRLHEAGKRELDEVDREYEYDVAKRCALLKKLTQRYLADLDSEDVTVHGFANPHALFVCTLRTQSLSAALLAAAQDMESVSLSSQAEGTTQDVQVEDNASITQSSLDATGQHVGEDHLGSTAAFEERRKARLVRKSALEALAAKRPGPNDDYAPDVQAVEWAKENMGDYKLKSSKDYKPASGKRVDAITKRKELVQLELHIHSIRSTFNRRVVELRARKSSLLQALQLAQDEIAVIDDELVNGATPGILASAGFTSLPTPANLAHSLATPFQVPELVLMPDELPVSQPPLSLADMLHSHSGENNQASNDSNVINDSDSVEGLDPYYPSILQPLLQSANTASVATAAAHPRWRFDGAVPAVGALSGAASQEEVVDALRRYTALADRKGWLRTQQARAVAAFDRAVAECNEERLRVQVACAASASKLLVLCQELELLRDMSKRDAALETRLAKAKADKASVAAAVTGYVAQLAEKRAELDALQAKEKVLLAEFDEIVGTAHPAYAQLLKIYKKKVKRAKPTDGKNAENAGDNDISDDDDDLDDLGDDLGSEDEEEEEACPEGCEKATFERVVSLRERRLDIDDAAAELNKAMDEIRKSSDRFSQREKTIDKELNGIIGELTAFQREKQSRLNMIGSVVVLKASQILAGVQPPAFRVASDAPSWFSDSTPLGMLPSSIEHCVVFTRGKLRSLRSRIDELQEERSTLEKHFKELHKDERRLVNDKKRLEAEIAASRQRCDELQMLKFGKLIDIDALDRATSVSTAAVAEMSATINSTNAEFDAEIVVVKNKMTIAQERLLELTRQHTRLLETIAALTAKQNALEASLSGRSHAAADTTALASALGATKVLVSDRGDDIGVEPSLTSIGGSLIRSSSTPIKPLGELGVTSSMSSMQPQSNAVKIGMINVAALNRTLASLGKPAASTLRGSKAGGGVSAGITVADAASTARSDALERARLVDTVRVQAQQIAEMKAEIAALRRKGTAIHVPRHPNPAPAASGSALHHSLSSTASPREAIPGIEGFAAVR